MLQSNLADDAGDFIFGALDGEAVEIALRIKGFYDFADELARQSGAVSFLDMAERGTPMSMVKAVELSMACYSDAASEQTTDRGFIAAVHLMAFNLVRGLEQAPEAKKIAELAAHLFAQEYAYRRLTGKLTT